MNIEFGCDFGRESFRMALLRTIVKKILLFVFKEIV
jgi:hypothetical protein